MTHQRAFAIGPSVRHDDEAAIREIQGGGREGLYGQRRSFHYGP
jgi:hypothetical protein